MAREKEGYRDVLERLRSTYPCELLTVAQVAEFAGCNKVTASRRYSGWVGEHRGKRMPATVLARQMC